MLKRQIISDSLKKILFLGLGGAGQRHLRIFNTLLPNVKKIAFRHTSRTPTLNADFTVAKSETLEERYNLEVFKNLDQAYEQKPNLVVISLPSANLADAVVDAANHGCNVFVEKPAAVNMYQVKRIRQAISKNQVNFFVSFQRRFHPIINKIKLALHSNLIGPIMSVSVNVGSYVPAWHPYENFLELYACKKELGGGVLRTECHELDMLNWIFGSAKKVYGILQNRYKYKLNVEDSANLILDYGSFCASVDLCFMSKVQERLIEIRGQKGYIKCDFNRNNMIHLDYASNSKKYFKVSKLTQEDLFFKQAKYFIDNEVDFKEDYINAIDELCKIFDSVEISDYNK